MSLSETDDNETACDDFAPLESLLGMKLWEEYVFRVVNYTSRYNNSNSYYYAPVNLVGKYVKYPSYGDFPEAYFLRSYGEWWKQSEAYQRDYRPQDSDLLGAEDYVTLEFETAVVPREVFAYEIYNPGAIVRIWGRLACEKFGWVLLWEGLPQSCRHSVRKFCPELKKVNDLVNTIRIEFNQSHLRYHYSIDAVLLAGFKPTEIQYKMIIKGLVKIIDSFRKKGSVNKIENCDNGDRSEDSFLSLPYEVMIHIFQYLDLKSLTRCAYVSKRWNEASLDPVLYHNLSLKPYWHLIDCKSIVYFTEKCKSLKKLDLSWCGNDTDGFAEKLSLLLCKSCKTLTRLSLGNCNYISDGIMRDIANCKELQDLRLKNTKSWLTSHLNELNKLVSLDLTATDIQDNDLIEVLKSNRNLKHIILDLCESLVKLDQVAEAVALYNKKLTVWSSWKTLSLTSDGVKHFGDCPELKELDLGWCLINKDPSDCLEYVADGCGKLKRLILSEWRGLTDNFLLSVIMNCKELSQLDLLGIKNISEDVCEKALYALPKLRLLDISFCDSIRQEEVDIWRRQFPHITIQRSCQFEVADYLN